MKVAVVTPTIGTQFLGKCLDSVQKQTYDDITHYVFVDGQEHFSNSLIGLYGVTETKRIKCVYLEDNIGKGWYGHRVYAACSFLVNADVIIYLDEDNWFEPNHVESLISELQKGNQWAYSLRKIYDGTGNFICEDNCESLGKWPVYFNDQVFHIDTSCYAVRRDVAVAIGHAWYGQWGADRQFFMNLSKHFTQFECTKKHSMCYRLDGNPNSVKSEFFFEGNKKNQEKYNGNFPWKK